MVPLPEDLREGSILQEEDLQGRREGGHGEELMQIRIFLEVFLFGNVCVFVGLSTAPCLGMAYQFVLKLLMNFGSLGFLHIFLSQLGRFNIF